YDLRNYYRLINVTYGPKILSLKDEMKIEGTCVAAKGNIIVFKNDNHLFSINAHDLIGRELVVN
ncbi:MAG: hypothetical protein NT120_01170, partial [Candidatus Aenigmarchaeota archaeon]|nr:hypothetical protein [Candidatus Aenigmarchaeota archaeon]